MLDTNVVSEPMKPRPSSVVIEWLDQQAPNTLYLASTSLAELLLGIELMPAGKRRREIANDLVTLLAKLFGPRILPFDAAAATAYASLQGRARAVGRSVSMSDGQIAAIAAAHRFKVASRDTSPFASLGADLINPWTAGV